MTENRDVVVVGGGAAGLSAALVLGRAMRRTLVVDAGEPRNAPSAHLQGYLTRDGMSPAEFLAVGRAEIARYGWSWSGTGPWTRAGTRRAPRWNSRAAGAYGPGSW